MVKLALSFAAIGMFFHGSAAAQNNAKAASKAMAICARVSQDAKTLFGTDRNTWSVINPDTLVGHEGQQVKVKGRILPDHHSIRVLAVKALNPQIQYAANYSGFVFRR
jgi:hypothetical protein